MTVLSGLKSMWTWEAGTALAPSVRSSSMQPLFSAIGVSASGTTVLTSKRRTAADACCEGALGGGVTNQETGD